MEKLAFNNLDISEDMFLFHLDCINVLAIRNFLPKN